jgi:hypothetical protein
MTRESIISSIIEYFKENEDVFNDCIEELDGWNGYLNDGRYYSMDELAELYNGVDPIELLNRAYFGYDMETWHTDSDGNKVYGSFNPNREYFTYNGYGNLVSTDYKDYSAYLDDYFVEALEDARKDLYSIDDNSELSELFDSLESVTE